ncbi:VOC family protein [Tenacibaculum amylolyticum]|uniref:VOC family protein n=1 Tax=Tenacibaculum amylolyticum TaxID=104269 RepID=UPI003896117B
MQFDRTGFILYTINYEKCVQFYRDILELDILFETETITCFSFNNAYLMIEKDDEYNSDLDYGNERIKTCLRMNVPDVLSLANKLKNKHIKVDYQEHSWGTVAKFFDPDGNLCAFKDSIKFEQQIKSYTFGK